MASLGINLDHIATVRQARRTVEPDPVSLALLAELGGADGITVHLREDRRHIQDRDVELLRGTVRSRLNLEMAATAEMVAIALAIKPDMVTLVPEKREEVTTEGGLEVARQLPAVKRICTRMCRAKIEVSLFINPDARQVDAAAEAGAQFIELHTGQFAEHHGNARNRRRELNRLIAAAEHAHSLGLRVNAGHGLNYENLPTLHAVPHLEELNIGHSIISRSVEEGLAKAVKEMLRLMKGYRSG